MATSLTPELLKQLQAQFAQSSSGYTPQVPQEFGGQMYQQNVNQGGYAGEGGDGGSFTPYGYTSYEPGATTGDKWSQYDTKGDFTREGILKEDPWLKNLLIAAAGAFGMSQIPVGGLGNVGGVAGPGEAGWGLDLGGGEMFNPAMDSQLANVQGGFTAGGGGVGGGSAGGVSAASPAAGASWTDKLTSLVGGGGSSLLGLGATALGGLAGAQGQNADSSSTRKMDPRLDQPVFGDLIPRAQSLLGQQMSPERQQGYRQMQTMGQSLLGRPIAGNDFERFYGGR
jgi:hypothetical protein